MKELLLHSRSKKTIEKAASIAAADELAFKELVILMKDVKEMYLAGLAAWAMSHAVDKNRKAAAPYTKDFIRLIRQTDSDAIKRNIVRIWQTIVIPEKYRWEVADICFNLMKSSKEAIAVKAFSITVLQRLMPELPELKNEVVFELERQLPHSPPAFRVRAAAFFKKVS